MKSFVDKEALTETLAKLNIKTSKDVIKAELSDGLEYYYSLRKGENRK